MTPESLEAFIRQEKEEGLSASIVSACRLEKGYSKETIYKYMLLLLPQGG